MNGRAPILVVDDDVDARALLAEILERRGHTVVTRSNGKEALAYLQEGPRPRLILLDLHMPLMDGYELHAQLATDDALASVPVVLMTDERSVDRARLGSIAILPKPLRVQQLLTVLDTTA